MRRVAAVLGFVLSSLFQVHAQTSPPLDLGGKKQWITFAGPDEKTVAANKPVDVPLHFRIEQGFHINSHTPKSDYLIPTQLMIVESPGLAAQKVDFPAGTDYAFSFDPKNKLDVYTGDITLVAHVQVTPGSHVLQGVLRYQACDRAACYPPKTLAVEVELNAR
jgi:hypothetical protein